MSLEERDTTGAAVAGYGLLASLALTVLKRFALVERGGQVRPVSEEDTRHLSFVRELLAGSVRGAVLAGRQSTSQDLMGGSENMSLDAKLQIYHVVDAMVGHDQYDHFIRNAQTTLEKLMRDRDRRDLTTAEKSFVDRDLTHFLERLQRGSDYVVAEHEPLGLHRALA